MQWPATTFPANPRSRASAHTTSRFRLQGSSVSSQWKSSFRSSCSARSNASRTLSQPSSVVRSKCGIAPTASHPRATASSHCSRRPRARRIPSCGNATTWSSIPRAASFLAPDQGLDGEQRAGVTWVRIRSVPHDAYISAVAMRPLPHVGGGELLAAGPPSSRSPPAACPSGSDGARRAAPRRGGRGARPSAG